MIRDEQFVFRPDGHQLQTFRPALNHLVQPEGDRLTALVTAIKNRAIHQRTLIVYLHFVGGFGLLSDGGFQHFILQSARGYLHALTLRILCQECFALCLRRTCHFRLQLREEFSQHLLRLLVGNLRLLLLQYILDSRCQIVVLQRLHAAAHQVLTHAQTDCITYLIHIMLYVNSQISAQSYVK